MSSIFKGSPYRRPNDVEAGSSRSAHSDDEDHELSTDPFYIPSTKNAPIDRLRRWRQAALVLNASRRFRYTLDLKREEEKKQVLRKIRAHAQAIRAAHLFKQAGEQVNGTKIPQPVPGNDFSIGPEQLASVSRDHNFNALQEHGGVHGLSESLKTNLEKGIPGDDSDLQIRRNAFGSNTYPRKKGRSFWILFEDPVPLPVVAPLIAILVVLRISSPQCACAVINSVTYVNVKTAKMPHLGSRWALLLTSLILVMIVHWRSVSPSSGTAAVEKCKCFDFSWVLLCVINLSLLYMALKQRSIRISLFFY